MVIKKTTVRCLQKGTVKGEGSEWKKEKNEIREKTSHFLSRKKKN
jgi:hypothetical protein